MGNKGGRRKLHRTLGYFRQCLRECLRDSAPSFRRASSLRLLAFLLCCVAFAAASNSADDLKRKTYKPPRVLFNWDGNDAMRQLEWPATPGKLVRTVLEEYAGSDIDTFLWSMVITCRKLPPMGGWAPIMDASCGSMAMKSTFSPRVPHAWV